MFLPSEIRKYTTVDIKGNAEIELASPDKSESQANEQLMLEEKTN